MVWAGRMINTREAQNRVFCITVVRPRDVTHYECSLMLIARYGSMSTYRVRPLSSGPCAYGRLLITINVNSSMESCMHRETCSSCM
jgi:hypothetical protein